MLARILVVVAVTLVLFLGYVSTRKSEFRYERTGVINAPAEKIFPYLTDFKKGSQWNPFDQKDPQIKRTFSGPENQIGSAMEFDGNQDAGTGKIEILEIVPNQLVKMRLIMTKPFPCDNLIEYRLTPEGTGTRMSWAMSGDGGFMGKLISVFIDCEKMVAGEFVTGINQLKALVESATRSS